MQQNDKQQFRRWDAMIKMYCPETETKRKGKKTDGKKRRGRK